ncbi:MAG: FKBP-type peptidyl-prolyl cis-trans isomerase [Flavobacteriales bacterium]|nr:FKBP-type peptidyl-prolyl cis-trans isomerase [Flavobacteriales bacterium]MCB9365000.1 FKBP-type peptidyl-prolyl cis-trans isomerase [Flavobacteriales bacterium]
MKKIIIILCGLLFLYSCQEKIEGFTLIDEGVYLKLLSFEDEAQSYQNGDFVKASFSVCHEEKVIYQNFKYIPFLPTNKSFDLIFTHLNKGDSVELLVSKSIFNDNSFGFSSKKITSDLIKINMKIHDFLSEKEYDVFQKQNDEELVEQQILRNYLTTEQNIEEIEGVYYVKLQKTNDNTVQKGDVINIQYSGSFINGVVFDTTFRKQPFELVYGTPNQVIEGLEKVLKVLKNGEKAKIIIPSQFAFGEKGSSTGLIPPYSTVIYNLEIINIK